MKRHYLTMATFLFLCGDAVAQTFTRIPIEDPTWQANNVLVHAVNDSGLAVGAFTGPSGVQHAYSFRHPGVYTQLYDAGYHSEAYAVNNNEVIVGSIFAGAWYGIVWTPDGGAGILWPYPNTLHCEARGINDAGQIAGQCSFGGQWMAVTWPSPGSQPILLTEVVSNANAVNRDGYIAGGGRAHGTGTDVGFRYHSSGMSWWSAWGESYAFAINAFGNMAGRFVTGGQTVAARFFVTSLGARRIQNLGTLGGATSTAFGINNLEQTVGTSTNASGSARGFFRNPGAGPMLDLNNMISNPDGSTIVTANGLNDNGQIVVEMLGAFSGRRAALLIPNP